MRGSPGGDERYRAYGRARRPARPRRGADDRGLLRQRATLVSKRVGCIVLRPRPRPDRRLPEVAALRRLHGHPDEAVARRRSRREHSRSWIVFTTLRVAGSIRRDGAAALLATQTAPSPNAIAVGPWPTGIVEVAYGAGVDPCHGVVSAVRDPDRPVAERDRRRRLADRDRP